MSAFDNHNRVNPDYSGLQHYDYNSQAPEVVPLTTLPEVVPAPQYDQHYYPQQHQYNQQQWPKQDGEVPNSAHPDSAHPNSAYPSSAYPESQSGWTSVSQRIPPPVEEPEKAEAPAKTILGLRRRKFWLIIGPLLLVLAIGLGVGLGVGLSGKTSGSGPATSTSPGAAPSPLTCPAGNNTIATDSGTRFLVVCDVDYNGNDPSSGTTDLASTNVTSVYQCMDVCASNKDCAGAWFGDYFGLKCFLKSRLGVQGPSDSSIFVIKQT